MNITRIVVDKYILDGFKRRALKEFPKEHIEAILGKAQADGTILQIHAFDEIEKYESKKYEVNYAQPEDEIEAGTTLKYYGTLHTHPTTDTTPSSYDWKDFLGTQEDECLVGGEKRGYYVHTMADEIMGIMYINKNTRQKFFGFAFYNRQGNQIELVISEKLRKNEL